MAKKKEVYISAELDWAEEKLLEWKEYADANPLSEIKDRIDYRPTKNGGVIPMVVQTIEGQIKSVRDTLKEYLALLEVVNQMRKDKAKEEELARGGSEVPYRMRNRDK